jgi:predicted metal-dependent peptidase
MYTIEKVIYNLLNTEPFFANFILGTRIIFNHPQVPTAGAAVTKDGDIELVFNTDFMDNLSLGQQKAVLKHEVFHLLLEHCGTRAYGTNNRMAKNIAMDCAINQHIENIPEGGVTLKQMEELLKRKLNPLEAWEYYYEHIKDHVKDSSEKHNHDYMDAGEELEGSEAESVKAQRRIAVKNAAMKAVTASAGNIPDSIASILDSLNKQGKVSWKQQLRNIIASARIVNTKPTRQRVNRRFELEQPGRKKIKKLIVGVCLDSSGSVSDEAYSSFMTEVYHLSKQTTATYVVHADCSVQQVDKIKNGKAKQELLQQRHGGGGTAYQPAISECMKRKCDVIIYFGDMDSADTPKNPGVPFIWVRVGKQNPPGNFGKVIDI